MHPRLVVQGGADDAAVIGSYQTSRDWKGWEEEALQTL
jgi:hypothetical protein